MKKVCTKCKIEKEFSCFNYSKLGKYNLEAYCKDCQAIRKKEWRSNNKEKINETSKNWRDKNKDKIKSSNKKYRDNNKEKFKKYYLKRKDERKKSLIKFHENNPDYRKNYNEKNKTKMREYQKNYIKDKRKNNINFKIANNFKIRISHLISGRKIYKSINSIELLGCTIEELKQHLESQFKDGMSWENHGPKGWHIDHIKPCASFDLTDPEEQKKCFHYSNLQPLWWIDNLKKGSKIL